MQHVDSVGNIRNKSLSKHYKSCDYFFYIKRLTANRLEHCKGCRCALAHQLLKTSQVTHISCTNTYPQRFVRVCGSNSLQSCTDLCITESIFGNSIKRLVPRKNKLSKARDFQSRAGHTTTFQNINLVKQRRHVDNDSVANYRSDVFVQDSARNKLQCIALIAYDNGMAGVVSALIANYM